jgi:hypothetical protein
MLWSRNSLSKNVPFMKYSEEDKDKKMQRLCPI